jgi:hypothetical protein
MVPTVIAKANQIAQDTAYATGTGAGDAAFDRRITPVQSTVTGIPIGTRGSALLDQVAPNMAQLERRRSIQNLYQQLLHIGNDLLGVLPRASELGGKVPGATIAARRVLPGYREGFAALDAAIDNIVNVMARSVGEQKGAQTEQDAERAYNTIAQLRSNIYNPFGGDTWESAAARLNETIGHLENVYAGMPGPVVPGSPGNWRPGTPPPAPPTGLGAPGTTPIQGMPPEWEWGPNGEILHFGEPL